MTCKKELTARSVGDSLGDASVFFVPSLPREEWSHGGMRGKPTGGSPLILVISGGNIGHTQLVLTAYVHQAVRNSHALDNERALGLLLRV